MTEEDKKVEETTVEETQEQKPEESKSEENATKETTPEAEEPKEEDTPDYKALLDEEKSRREKAEHKIVKMRAKKLEEEPEETLDEEEEEDKIYVDKAYVDNKLSEVKYVSLQAQFDSEIDKMSSDPDEKELIRLHLEDNNFSGSLTEQVQKAKALANYKRVAKANKELVHAKGVNPGGENSSSYPINKSNTKGYKGLSERDIKHLKERGLVDRYLKNYG